MITQRHFVISLAALSTAVFVAACSSSSPVVEESAPEAKEATAPAALSWGYDDATGPAMWGNLNPSFSSCSQGRSQSPVNLVWSKPGPSAPRVETNYTDSTATIENTNYTPRLLVSGVNQLMINGMTYNLQKIEFHSPSEHQLSNTPLSMEIQLFHQSSSSEDMAVVSLFAIEGRENALVKEVMGQLSAQGQGFQLNASKLMPPRRTYYHYKGSLTTPPCTENVEWIIYNTPMELSRDQILAFRGLYPQNNRPLQPVNGRAVKNY